MIFRRGTQADWGELTGFPKTGTTVEWRDDGGRPVQRGHYQYHRHRLVREIYEHPLWRSAVRDGRVYAWPRGWRYW